VPLIVITFADQEAVTPGGKPVAVPIPVARVVECVIFGVKTVFTANVGLVDPALTVLSTQGVTVVVVIVGEGPTALVATTEKI
jgi:hypothetical protein